MSTLWALLHHYVGLVQRAELEVNTPVLVQEHLIMPFRQTGLVVS